MASILHCVWLCVAESMSALHAVVVADNTADIDAAIAAGADINATDAVSQSVHLC